MPPLHLVRDERPVFLPNRTPLLPEHPRAMFVLSDYPEPELSDTEMDPEPPEEGSPILGTAPVSSSLPATAASGEKSEDIDEQEEGDTDVSMLDLSDTASDQVDRDESNSDYEGALPYEELSDLKLVEEGHFDVESDIEELTSLDQSNTDKINVEEDQAHSEYDNNREGSVELGSSYAPKSFAELLQVSKAARLHPLNNSLRSDKWRMLELEEMKRNIDKELAALTERRRVAEGEISTKDAYFRANRHASGISQELWDEYESFCESLEPKLGDSGGWSITCDEDHHGSYVDYDPHFTLFKEYAETDYKERNFRCEASVIKEKSMHQATEKWEALWVSREDPEHVVEFWKAETVEPKTGGEELWIQQYPRLYKLATSAATAGSEAAMDMLIVLPDMFESFKGGWLFEYAFDGSPDPHPVKSRQWSFRSAHNIDKPESKDHKREKLGFMLRWNAMG